MPCGDPNRRQPQPTGDFGARRVRPDGAAERLRHHRTRERHHRDRGCVWVRQRREGPGHISSAVRVAALYVCYRLLSKAQSGGTAVPLPGDNISWSQETALDLDMASAICPGCNLLLVEANSNSLNDLSTAVTTAGRLGAHAISNSYGAAESQSFATYEPRYNIPGVAVTVSTGDAGYGVQFPASSPHVVAVGGTSLTSASNSRGWSETVWNGTGSGCSTVFAKPSWQVDTGCGKRTAGDVAAVADPNTGVAVYAPGSAGSSGWYVFGGTSAGAPIIAAAYAINGGR